MRSAFAHRRHGPGAPRAFAGSTLFPLGPPLRGGRSAHLPRGSTHRRTRRRPWLPSPAASHRRLPSSDCVWVLRRFPRFAAAWQRSLEVSALPAPAPACRSRWSPSTSTSSFPEPTAFVRVALSRLGLIRVSDVEEHRIHELLIEVGQTPFHGCNYPRIYRFSARSNRRLRRRPSPSISRPQGRRTVPRRSGREFGPDHAMAEAAGS